MQRPAALLLSPQGPWPGERERLEEGTAGRSVKLHAVQETGAAQGSAVPEEGGFVSVSVEYSIWALNWALLALRGWMDWLVFFSVVPEQTLAALISSY